MTKRPSFVGSATLANLFDPAGKPFGWAHHAERDHIRQHLRRRIWKFGFDEFRSFRLEQRINEIQRRLHKYDESFAVRSRRWREQQEERCRREAKGATAEFTWEELDRLVEHFEGANDPVSAEIARKAAALLSDRDPRGSAEQPSGRDRSNCSDAQSA